MDTKNIEVTLNPNNTDELDVVITPETLNKLKELFPKKVDEIFKISRAELIELKELIKANKQSEIENILRKNLIEDDIDGKEKSESINETKNEKFPNIDTITLGAKSEKINNIYKIIANEIISKIEKYGLSVEQINNITVGITAKILKSGILSTIFEGLGDGAKKMEGNLEKGAIKTAIKGGEKKISELGKMPNILDNNMKDIIYLIETNRNNKDLNTLLANPKSIEIADRNTILNKIPKLNEKELTQYLLSINKDVLKYDKEIIGFENKKESMVNLISKDSEGFQNFSKLVLDFLLKIPFLGSILAGLLGYNSTKEALDGYGEELKYAKATNNLISHGGNLDKKNFFTYSSNKLTIEILKDKNLNNLEYKKLKPFFETCKKEGIDYTKNDFWFKLFNGNIDKTKEEKFFKLNEQLTSKNIKNEDFENKKPKESFYKKLNNLIGVKVDDTNTQNTDKNKTEEEKIKK